MDKTNIKHVAIIMDGNRRWAKKQHLPTILGHEEGSKKIEPLVESAIKLGLESLTFWAFSTENWSRGKDEVGLLIKVFRKVLKDPMFAKLNKNGVKVNIIGDITPFPDDIKNGVEKILDDTKNNKTITVNFALNYGGRAEIIKAVNEILKAGKQEITPDEFGDFLYTKGQPDPDLIVRTGGEKRLSGYLLWQAAYSELYFTDVFWPDFTPQEFDKAIKEYRNRERRFGK